MKKIAVSGQPGWYLQSLQLLHVVKSPTFDYGDLILHQLPVGGRKENVRVHVIQLGFYFQRV